MDKAKEAIQEAYEKNILLNEETTDYVADAFARFAIGDRGAAVKALQRIQNSPITGLDGESGLIKKVFDKDNMKKYNELFANMRKKFSAALKGK